MKILAIAAIVVAALCLAIGGGIVVLGGTAKFISPNGLLRLTDTSLLFAITILLVTIVLQKK